MSQLDAQVLRVVSFKVSGVVKQDLAAATAVFLAGVFAIAAIAKLRTPTVTRRAVADFGLSPLVARLLPWIELQVCCLLLASPRLGGAAAGVLLMGFTALVVRSLSTGQRVRCGCFGGTDDRPLGASTLVRNALLLAASLLAATGTLRPNAPSMPAFLATSAVACAGALVVALAGLRSDTGAWFPSAVHVRRTP